MQNRPARCPLTPPWPVGWPVWLCDAEQRWVFTVRFSRLIHECMYAAWNARDWFDGSGAAVHRRLPPGQVQSGRGLPIVRKDGGFPMWVPLPDVPPPEQRIVPSYFSQSCLWRWDRSRLPFSGRMAVIGISHGFRLSNLPIANLYLWAETLSAQCLSIEFRKLCQNAFLIVEEIQIKTEMYTRTDCN